MVKTKIFTTPLAEQHANLISSNDMMCNAKLLVVGDSHSLFWKGHDEVRGGSDNIPGVITCEIEAALAWTLVKEGSTKRGRERSLEYIQSAVEQGFHGCILLSFGEIDMRAHVMKQALSIGIVSAVRDITDRYVNFIDELRAFKLRLAVWAPIASPPYEIGSDFTSHWPTIGTEVERNFATVLFTNLLKKRLHPRNIPVLSLIHQLLHEDGTTIRGFLHDGIHLSQVLMPSAIDLVKKDIGLDLIVESSPLDLQETIVIDYCRKSELYTNGCNWVTLELLDTMLVKTVSISLDPQIPIRHLNIRTSLDGVLYTNHTFEAPTGLQAGPILTAQLNLLARFVWVASPEHALRVQDLQMTVMATRLSTGHKGNGCSREMIFAMGEAIAALDPLPAG